MLSYPKTLVELERAFPTEEACIKYLTFLRWHDGFCCTRCQEQTYWKASRGRRICTHCGYQASVTTGTILERTRMPLKLWFKAVWLLCARHGIGALQFQRELRLGSYETAWTCLHKLRRAMGQGFQDLSGTVHVGHIYFRTLIKEVLSQRVSKDALIAVAIQMCGSSAERVRIGFIEDIKEGGLQKFCIQNIKPNSTIYTREDEGYDGLSKDPWWYKIETDEDRITESKLVPYVYVVVQTLKRWFRKNFHGTVSRKHLKYYLDEISFWISTCGLLLVDDKRYPLWERFHILLKQILYEGATPYIVIVNDAQRSWYYKKYYQEILLAQQYRRKHPINLFMLREYEGAESGLSVSNMNKKLHTQQTSLVGYGTGSNVSQIKDQWLAIAEWAISHEYQLKGFFADLSAEASFNQIDLESAAATASCEGAALVVSCLSSLTQSVLKAAWVMDYLSEVGGVIICLNQQIVVNLAEEESVLGIISTIGSIDRKQAQTLLAEQKRQRASSKHIGHIPYGMRIGKCGIHLIPDIKEIHIVAQILELKRENRGYKEIAEDIIANQALVREKNEYNSKYVRDICKLFQDYEVIYDRFHNGLIKNKYFPNEYILQKNLKVDALEKVRRCLVRQFRDQDALDRFLSDAMRLIRD